MNRSRAWLIVLGLFLVAASACSAQPIRVTVDGAPVQFERVGPQVVQGRVLVPLRGVFEQMGAFVDWVPATRTVLAQRGDRDIVLRIGSRTALINQQPVTLDVPATIIAGTTMVPLRFIGEALGADVQWDAATRTVAVTTLPVGVPPGRGPTPPIPVPPVQPVPEVRSISHNAVGWLTAGSTLEVVMEGTPGGVAQFEVPGVVTQVGMREVTAGRYVGSWTVPLGVPSVTGARVLALLRVGERERLVQAGVPINIDAAPPTVRNLLPEPNSSITQVQPNISAVFDDGAGSGVAPGSVRIIVNGVDVTARATVTTSFVSYLPPTPLPAGSNSVTVTMRDIAGNTATRTWNFTVVAAPQVIRTFTHNATVGMAPGSVITVLMEATAGGRATFAFVAPTGQTLWTQAMTEISPGVYRGDYTVRIGDNLTGAAVLGTFVTAQGQTFTIEAPGRIGTAPAVLTPPTITVPAQGAAVTSPLVITGTAPPSTRVRLRVDYVTTLLGAVRIPGVATDQVVDVDAAGRFQSQPIQLGTLIPGGQTVYTLTALTLGPEGQESEPRVVTFTRA